MPPINPTEEQLQNRVQATGQLPQTLSQENLSAPQTPLVIPPTQPPQDAQSFASASIESLLKDFSAPSEEETSKGNIQTQILGTLNTLGTQRQRKQTLESEAGLPGQRQELQSVVNQLQGLQKEALAIPLQIQQEATGRGVTTGGVAPVQTGRLRENAIKSLGLAAIGQTLQGNITLAESTIQNALDAEFEPERTKLATLEKLYTFNKDALERVDKKRADALNISIAERTRLLGIQEANKKEIYDIGKIATQYGAPSTVVQKIYGAKTREEAVSMAGQYLTDPKAKFELESARLDNVLKQAQITKTQKETQLLGEPSKEEQKAQAEALKNAETAVPLLQDKINLIDTLKTHPGLASTVGPNPFARFGILSPLTGKAQEFAGGVHQLVNKETIDTLVNLKERGGTLGALSDQERLLLQSAATKIGDWEIKNDNNIGVGKWNIDEASFKRELDTIKSLSQRALTKARGDLLSDDEQAVLDALEVDNSFNPAF